MISTVVSRLVILVFGTLFPAYYSYKAVKTKNVKEYVKWMMYWIVFAFFTCLETLTDLFLSFWFPFYYELKILVVLWLLSPATRGSSILYRKFVHPWLTRREEDIDNCIAQAKHQGYSAVLSLGSKGVNYATNVIMQTAIKGGGGLMSQLKRSYSSGELIGGDDGDLNRNTKPLPPHLHDRYDDNPLRPAPGTPQYRPSSPQYTSETHQYTSEAPQLTPQYTSSPQYTTQAPQYTTPQYTHQAPQHTSETTQYTHSPPQLSQYSPSSPQYTPSSPQYTPSSPQYSPSSPQFTPDTPHSPSYIPPSALPPLGELDEAPRSPPLTRQRLRQQQQQQQQRMRERTWVEEEEEKEMDDSGY